MSLDEQIAVDAATMVSIIRGCPSDARERLYSAVAAQLRAYCLNFQASHFEILTLSEQRGKQPVFIG